MPVFDNELIVVPYAGHCDVVSPGTGAGQETVQVIAQLLDGLR